MGIAHHYTPAFSWPYNRISFHLASSARIDSARVCASIMAVSYRRLLVQTSSNLSREDLANLVFCCEDYISEAEAEKISSGIDLFKALKHQNLLGPDNYEYLREQLLAIGRVDLANLLPTPLQTALCNIPSNQLSLLTTEFSDAISSDHCKPSSGLAVSSTTGKLRSLSASPRAQLLQVCDSLTEDNVCKLSFLFADKLSLRNRKEKIRSPLDLLTSLEATGVISMACPESLVEPLEEIGRKDLASQLLSHISMLSLPSSLNISHQLFEVKISMLKGKQSDYSMQRKILYIVANSDSVSLNKQLVSPIAQTLLKLYDYSTVSKLSAETRAAVKHSKDLTGLLCSTLSDIYSIYEFYFECLFHALECKKLDMDVLISYYKTCHSCYSSFEKCMSEMNWNMDLIKDVRNEFTERRTPMGTPALKAVTCIYEVCSELCGGSELEEVMKMVDRNLYALESMHYTFCCRIIITQWVETLVFLLDEMAVTISTVRSTLLDILRKNLDSINCLYKPLSCVIGKTVMESLKDQLKFEGIEINEKDPQSCTGRISSKFIMTVSFSSSAYLLLLLYIAYFGGANLDLCGIFSRLKQYVFGFMTTNELFLACTKTISKNVISSFENQVDGFKAKALEANRLCSLAIDQIIRT